MLTRRGIALVAGGVGCWAVGRLLGVTELYLFAVALPVLVAAGVASVYLTDQRLAMRRRLSTTRAQPDERLEAAIDLRNDGRIDAGLLLVTEHCPHALRADSNGSQPRFVVPRVPAGGVRTLTYPLLATSRGKWEVGPLDIRIRDPFGVAERTRRYTSTTSLVVYPTVVGLAPGPTTGSPAGSGARTRRRIVGSGDEFHTMREYQIGDDLRHVHWSSSARHQQLMVRQNEQPWAARVTVLLDTRAGAHHGVGRHGSFEQAVQAAASVVAHYHGRGYETRLWIPGDRDAYRTADALDGHLSRLALVEPSHDADLRAIAQAATTSDGLLVAVLGATRDDPAYDRQMLAVVAAGRRFSSKNALVAAHGKGRDAVALLRATRWRATVLDDDLPEAWQRLATRTTMRAGA